MGNPHVVCVIEDAMSTLPRVEDLDLVTKPEVSPVLESDQNAEFVRVDEIDAAAGTGEATMRVNERGCGETLSCGTGLCATAITLRACGEARCGWTSPMRPSRSPVRPLWSRT